MAALADADDVVAYRRTADEVAAALGSDLRRGLTTAEAQARLERYGSNPGRTLFRAPRSSCSAFHTSVISSTRSLSTTFSGPNSVASTTGWPRIAAP